VIQLVKRRNRLILLREGWRFEKGRLCGEDKCLFGYDYKYICNLV